MAERSRPPATAAVVLGLLWLVDGLLQLQPPMFHLGPNGLAGTLADNAMVSPVPFYSSLEAGVVQLVVSHVTLANWLFAGVQVAIGAAIAGGALIGNGAGRAALRIGLVVSAAWALGVWVFGEAFGQMIFPQANMAVSGSPGAGLLYAAIAVLLLRPNPRAALAVWVAMWDGTALLLLERGNWAPGGLAAQVASQASGEPHVLASMDHLASRALAGVGLPVALGMLILQVLVGQSALRPLTRRASLILGAVVSAVYWVVGQDLGGVLSGHSTDPNLGPPAVLLAWITWSLSHPAAPEETGSPPLQPAEVFLPHAKSTRS